VTTTSDRSKNSSWLRPLVCLHLRFQEVATTQGVPRRMLYNDALDRNSPRWRAFSARNSPNGTAFELRAGDTTGKPRPPRPRSLMGRYSNPAFRDEIAALHRLLLGSSSSKRTASDRMKGAPVRVRASAFEPESGLHGGICSLHTRLNA
jgi:hypothetical protein